MQTGVFVQNLTSVGKARDHKICIISTGSGRSIAEISFTTIEMKIIKNAVYLKYMIQMHFKVTSKFCEISHGKFPHWSNQ